MAKSVDDRRRGARLARRDEGASFEDEEELQASAEEEPSAHTLWLLERTGPLHRTGDHLRFKNKARVHEPDASPGRRST
jgi:hypothetical protein